MDIAAGPHVMEVSVKGAHLTYPLTTMRSFCHDLVETYSHCVYPPWVDPYPQVSHLFILALGIFSSRGWAIVQRCDSSSVSPERQILYHKLVSMQSPAA